MNLLQMDDTDTNIVGSELSICNKKTLPFFTIKNRQPNDRIGANIFSYINQIAMAHYFNYYINIHEIRYEESIFVKTIVDYVEQYNSDKSKGDEIFIDEITQTPEFDDVNYAFHLAGFFTCTAKMDLFTYFKTHIYSDFIKIFEKHSQHLTVNFDPKKTILLHLRLDDLSEANSFDYDGDIVSKFFSEKINSDYFLSFQSMNEIYGKKFIKYLIQNKSELKIDEIRKNFKYTSSKFLHLFGCQSVIKEKRICNIIDKLLVKYPDNQVIIVTSPTGDVHLPYRRIRNHDPSIDLFYLSQCDKVILSRSTFALSSLFYSNASEIWIPKWTLITCCGLNTIYDAATFNYY